MRLKFQIRNFAFFATLLGIETGIALLVHDQLIRPFVGDLLVIWLMVYFLRSFLIIKNQYWLIGGVFLFACLVEVAQYYHLLTLMNLQENRLLFIVIGATFDWLDMLAYAVGSGLLLLLDFAQTKRENLND